MSEPTYTQRPCAYIRKHDGARVSAVDWPDGDVSWRLEDIPVISFQPIVGTCSAETFELYHVADEGMK